MKTKGVRLYGANDVRTEEFLLPPIKNNEILVKVVSDSICMSTYKTVIQGTAHKRVPANIDTNPILLGHEMAGDIVEVGSDYHNQFKAGEKFALQPALNYKGSMASPGYSYEYFGGASQYCIIPPEVMELGCLLPYNGEAYYAASLAEPMSCVIGGYNAMYHTKPGKYEHTMGIVQGGNLAILAGAGPMGLGAIDYALHGPKQPAIVVVTDIDQTRLDLAQKIFTQEEAHSCGVKLYFVNTSTHGTKHLMDITEGKGYDDIMVYAPIPSVLEDADSILAKDGCINFFAGPSNKDFYAKVNYYNVHYNASHIMGTTGGNVDDIKESIQLTEKGVINPAIMVTHVGGIDCIAETTKNLPNIPGGKKLTYLHIEMPLTAIEDFEVLGKEDTRFKELHTIVQENRGLWCAKAEKFLLEKF
ncbi:MAG: zinc-binding dehydrogenase [Defluviitaleaceae bacterium]|nr:zinc-binding dehydrogenase [Defluviitaleaceae bacterium]